jgi:hypothetical protein
MESHSRKAQNVTPTDAASKPVAKKAVKKSAPKKLAKAGTPKKAIIPKKGSSKKRVARA